MNKLDPPESNFAVDSKISVGLIESNTPPRALTLQLDSTCDGECSYVLFSLLPLVCCAQELGYGPNGGLIYAMEYLMENFAWLAEQINDYGDDYLIFESAGKDARTRTYTRG